METLAERLRYVIDTIQGRYPIKISEMNKDIGKDQSYIAQVLNGKNKAPCSALYDYLEARFNVNKDWLYRGVGEPFREGGLKDNCDVCEFIRKYHGFGFKRKQLFKVAVDLVSQIED